MNDSVLPAAHRLDLVERLLPQNTNSHDTDPCTNKYTTRYDLINIISPPPQPPCSRLQPLDLVRRHDLPDDRRCHFQVTVEDNINRFRFR